MRELVFFLEEPSAREMLKGVLPRLLPEDVIPRYVVFEGKQDLHKRLEKRLKGWIEKDTRFVVLRDQDSSDCVETKKKLSEICREAGKNDVLIRIACHELESWYLGNLEAVERGLGVRGLTKKQDGHKYRDPDRLSNASQELKNLTRRTYQKVSGSREIGPRLSLQENRSHSFNVFLSGLRRLIESHHKKGSSGKCVLSP
uniref:DUF4276 family protein n=1 Tax=Candidatus Kentrum sp. DK TaxID=2126562 RepID=A0A450TAX1_9GAMM|nr:MAG: protein of unknown function (DUF4276) [Candidatus Kentron sp. DK]